MNGREVYEKVHEQRSRSLDRKTEVTMVLFDKGGGKRTRTLTEYGKKSDPEAYKVLIVFKSPPDLKNVGFLIHAHTFADRDLWAYFPEYKRVRRIATSAQDDSFFGSDFSYDDFGGPPNLDDYKFSIVKEEVIDAKPCYVVEVTPKIHRKYTKYIAWVAKDLWIHLKIDYYQDNDIYRTGVFTDIRIIDGIPTPFKIDHGEQEDESPDRAYGREHQVSYTICGRSFLAKVAGTGRQVIAIRCHGMRLYE